MTYPYIIFFYFRRTITKKESRFLDSLSFFYFYERRRVQFGFPLTPKLIMTFGNSINRAGAILISFVPSKIMTKFTKFDRYATITYYIVINSTKLFLPVNCLYFKMCNYFTCENFRYFLYTFSLYLHNTLSRIFHIDNLRMTFLVHLHNLCRRLST